MTLLEVMVAVVVVVVMSMIVAESLRNSIEFNELLTERDSTSRQARVALSRIKREIQLAFLTPHQQAAENFVTVFVGLDRDPDELYFATLAHRRIYRDTRECDQAEITLWTEDAPKEKGEGYVLYHRESPRIDERPSEDGVIYPLAYNVRSLNLRYLDQNSNEWQEEWDTRKSETLYRLPRAVEVALVLITKGPDGELVDVPFLTTILLQFAPRLVNPSNPLASVTIPPPFQNNNLTINPRDISNRGSDRPTVNPRDVRDRMSGRDKR